MSRPTPIAIRTRGDVRRLVRDARTMAVLLDQPGLATIPRGQRQRMAATLVALCTIADRLLDEPEPTLEPDAYHGGEDLVGDLFDGAA